MIDPGKPVKIQIGDEWKDISPYIDNVAMSHGDETWGDKLKGLESASMSLTFDDSDDAVEVIVGAFFPTQPQKIRTTIDVPDGRWQSWKLRAKQRFPRLLRRLKVRTRCYSFDAIFDPWNGGPDITGTSDGPVTLKIEEK